MSTKTLTRKRESIAASPAGVARMLLIALLTPIILYYTWTRGFVYLNFSREVYTDYFWHRATWLLVHVIGGLLATLTGPVQFIPALRAKYPAWHRNLGKVYLASIFISTLASFYLAYTAQVSVAYTAGLGMLGIVWSVTSGMAYLAIRSRNLLMHKEWMIKSYVLTVAFVNFRVFEDLLAALGVSTFSDRKILMAWACWAVPFFVTEVVLQFRRRNAPVQKACPLKCAAAAKARAAVPVRV